MSRKDRLKVFAEQAGFGVEVESDVVRAVRVPCLLADGVVGTCTIEKSCDPANAKPNDRIGGAVHAVRITADEEHDGRVYHADGMAIGSYVDGDGKMWSNISIKKGGQASPEEDGSASDLIHRYAKQIVGPSRRRATPRPLLSRSRVRSRYPILSRHERRFVQFRIESANSELRSLAWAERGAYVLDLVAKSPVMEIHLLDFDEIKWHNFMRAPGAPTAEEIELRRKRCLRKVDYYHSKYASLREGIHPHAVRVDSPSAFGEFLSAHPIDYAFVCIDQLTDSDSPRQDVVYCALSEAGIPFIDSGVSITVEDCAVGGAVTTSAYGAGSVAWKDGIPNARLEGSVPGYRNVQLPEVNALAAALAVMEWRRPHRAVCFGVGVVFA